MRQGAQRLMLVKLIFNRLDFLWDDFVLIMLFYFFYVILVKDIELLFLGLESFEHFAFDDMVAFLFHLADDHFELIDFIKRPHNWLPGRLNLVCDYVGGFYHVLDVLGEVVLDLLIGVVRV